MSAKKRKTRKGRTRRARSVSTKPLPWNGDHGTGSEAATAGTVLEPVDGANPNRMARRVRKNVINTMLKRDQLTMRQWQAAQAIQLAWCGVQKLSSGGALKETVDATSKPDATVAAQVGAVSRLVHVTKPIRPSERALVEDVCYHNRPLGHAARAGEVRPLARFRDTMDRVANHMRY